MDFEQQALSELPDALTRVGHDRSRPTLTIWEGVTMYLTVPAIEATISALRTLSAPGSSLVMTYFTREGLQNARLLSRIVALFGEPFRHGFDPTELPSFFAARGFELSWDRSMSELARALLPEPHARRLRGEDRRIAEARIPLRE